VSKRAALPGASELFRATSSSAALADVETAPPVQREVKGPQASSPEVDVASTSSRHRDSALHRPTGRERHDEKITVYLSANELVALDAAKSSLYREQGLKIDRGRIVREAVAIVVADLQAKGEASILARRLQEG
jgi:hypothetical protein